MSLQVAFAGGKSQFLIEDDGFIIDPIGEYLEPGFNIMFPLEFQLTGTLGSTFDTIYITLRQRTNTSGTDFASISPSDFSTIVEDATTGSSIDHDLTTNTVHAGWNESDFDPLVLTIHNVDDVDNPTCRVRALDITIRKIDTNDFITFRVLLADNTSAFGYLVANNNTNENRPTISSYGYRGLVQLVPEGNYILLTPGSNFSETTFSSAIFSYPLESVYYKITKNFNDEEYTWTIDATSDDTLDDPIRNAIKITPVPHYPNVGLVRIDGYMLEALSEASGKIYFDVKATGKISSSEDTFRIYLKKVLTQTIDL